MSTPPLRILILGASTVAGRADREGGGFAMRFKNYHETKNPGATVQIAGVDGDTVAGMGRRVLTEAGAFNPELIIINTGVNDTRREGSSEAPNKTPINDYRQHLELLIDHAQRFAPVVFLSPFAIDESRTHPLRGADLYYSVADTALYVGDQQTICLHRRVPFCDVFTRWSREQLEKYWHRDGLHFGPDGHQALAQALIEFLENQK